MTWNQLLAKRKSIALPIGFHSRIAECLSMLYKPTDFDASQYPKDPALVCEMASLCLPRDYTIPNSEKSDIFAMDSTLYELVVGKEPYAIAELWASDPEPEPHDYDAIRGPGLSAAPSRPRD